MCMGMMPAFVPNPTNNIKKTAVFSAYGMAAPAPMNELKSKEPVKFASSKNESMMNAVPAWVITM